jgi:hypothetical protein
VLDTELSGSSLTVDYLGIVGVSLSLDLLDIVLLEDLCNVLSLVHLHHIGVDRWARVLWLVGFESIFLSWCHNSLFGVGRTDVVLLVTFGACDPGVAGTLVLVAYLNHLLGRMNLLLDLVRVNKLVLKSPLFVERYLNATIIIS